MAINLLIVDADDFFRQSLIRRLGATFFSVFESDDDGGRVKTSIRRHDIDVVLLCINEIKAEGLGLLRKIKRFRPAVEVILINGTGELSLSMESMKLGAFDDLLAPLDVKRLIARIREAYGRKKAREAATGGSLLKRAQRMLEAASFAEADAPEMALEYLDSEAGPAKQTNNRKERRDEKG